MTWQNVIWCICKQVERILESTAPKVTHFSNGNSNNLSTDAVLSLYLIGSPDLIDSIRFGKLSERENFQLVLVCWFSSKWKWKVEACKWEWIWVIGWPLYIIWANINLFQSPTHKYSSGESKHHRLFVQRESKEKTVYFSKWICFLYDLWVVSMQSLCL